MINSVLVFTPVHRLEPETVTAIFEMRWEGAISYLFGRENPHEDGRENILHQYQKGREIFLGGDWDAMLTIESDIIPPPSTLERLAGDDGDIICGIYRFRTTNVINVFERYPGNPRNEGESLSLKPDKLREAISANIAPVTGGGLGCSLIHREVIERIPFRHESTGYADTYFNRDALHYGFRHIADFRVICGHKDEDGEILWPDLRSCLR